VGPRTFVAVEQPITVVDAIVAVDMDMELVMLGTVELVSPRVTVVGREGGEAGCGAGGAGLGL